MQATGIASRKKANLKAQFHSVNSDASSWSEMHFEDNFNTGHRLEVLLTYRSKVPGLQDPTDKSWDGPLIRMRVFRM